MSIAKTQPAYDVVAESYARLVLEPFGRNPVDRSLVSAFVEMIGAGTPATVADIGCGPGHATNYLVERGLEAFGIDLSPVMIAVARRTCRRLRFDVGSMEDLDVPSAWVCQPGLAPPRCVVVAPAGWSAPRAKAGCGASPTYPGEERLWVGTLGEPGDHVRQR